MYTAYIVKADDTAEDARVATIETAMDALVAHKNSAAE